MADTKKVRYGTATDGPYEVEVLAETAEQHAENVGGYVVDDDNDADDDDKRGNWSAEDVLDVR